MLIALVLSSAANIALAGLLIVALRQGQTRERAHERRVGAFEAKEREYLNRIFYLVDKPWEQAPIDNYAPPEPVEADEVEWPESSVYGTP